VLAATDFGYDWLAAKPIFQLQGHKRSVLKLSLTDDPWKLISLSSDKILKVWDLRVNKCVQVCLACRCPADRKVAQPVHTGHRWHKSVRCRIQSHPIQSNPIQSNPIQSNPIQSNPIQSARCVVRSAPLGRSALSDLYFPSALTQYSALARMVRSLTVCTKSRARRHGSLTFVYVRRSRRTSSIRSMRSPPWRTHARAGEQRP
jgi:hypothetical protein